MAGRDFGESGCSLGRLIETALPGSAAPLSLRDDLISLAPSLPGSAEGSGEAEARFRMGLEDDLVTGSGG